MLFTERRFYESLKLPDLCNNVNAVFLSFFAGVITFAQVADKAEIQQEFRRRLSDSNGVSVHVSVITKEKSEEESMMKQLQEDVEWELEDADIRIISKEDLEYAPGRDWGYIL